MIARNPALRTFACTALLLACAACNQLGRRAHGGDGEGAAAEEQVDEDEDEGEAGESDEAKAQRRKQEKLRKKELEVEKTERGLHVAQLELKVARQETESEAAGHDFTIAEKARALEEAERELELFREVEQPLKQAERELAVERSERRLHEARADLEGILAIYEEEPEASAKEEIILRHRRDVEFAERSLAIQRQKASLELETGERKHQRELVAAVAKARRELDEAQDAKERDRVKGEIAMMKAEGELVELEHELEELRGELRRAKRAASE